MQQIQYFTTTLSVHFRLSIVFVIADQRQILSCDDDDFEAEMHINNFPWIEKQTITEKQIEMPIEIIVISAVDFI